PGPAPPHRPPAGRTDGGPHPPPTGGHRRPLRNPTTKRTTAQPSRTCPAELTTHAGGLSHLVDRCLRTEESTGNDDQRNPEQHGVAVHRHLGPCPIRALLMHAW